MSDSKPDVRGKFILKPDGVEQPDSGTGYSVNREIYLYHGRANSIRPYYHPCNPIILKMRDSKPSFRGKFHL